MMTIVESVRAEYVRYKTMAEAAIRQLDDVQLAAHTSGNSNSIATICWHVAGNLKSRFTDFLTSDGEKPWRHREEEFEPRTVTKAEDLERWEAECPALPGAVAGLPGGHLHRTVTNRRQSLEDHGAVHRSLANAAYHVGPIVFIAESLRGNDWTDLGMSPGKS